MSQWDDRLCLNCPIETCSESDPRCLYTQFVQIERKRKALATDKEAKQQHARNYYLKNRDKVRAKTKQWQLDNAERVREYQWERYHANFQRDRKPAQPKTDRREYYKAYNAKRKENNALILSKS